MRRAVQTEWRRRSNRAAITFVALWVGLPCWLHHPSLFAADAAAPTLSDEDRFFLETVQPLLESRCVACHGPELAEGGLRLDSREAALAGGDSGPALAPGEPNKSLLVQSVKRTHDEIEMPPQEKLSKRNVAALERWIKDGAPWPVIAATSGGPAADADEAVGDAWSDARNPIVRLFQGERLDLWSLRPIKRPKLPAGDVRDWPRQPLDRFVLARLEADGIAAPPMADPRTLARRLHFDLTGLPPTPQQVAEFEEAVRFFGADQACAALVDQLLASPRFGEHFSRMWLDVVRYSDSNGFDWDEFRPNAWRFRDYVIRSFNADKPFDQFVREQLAGDELSDGPPATAAEQELLIATGYLRLGPHDNAAKLFDEQDRSRDELMVDVTETTASAFLGLTLTCCRCHDHKYDPISQADHYRFRAFFAAMQFGDDVPLDLAADQAAIKSHNDELETELKPLRDKLAQLPEDDKAAREPVEKEIKSLEEKRRPFTHGLLMRDDVANVSVTRVLFQGDHKSPRDEVEAGFLSVLSPQAAKIEKSVNPASTGRRLTLANWIVAPENPLTARVFVNRVWGQLMGRPLVATPNDFGLAGAAPEDAELLDWLATEFVREGWSVKRLVRLIVTSAAYRQATSFTAHHFALRSPRRLSAEQLRDALLAVSGLLNTKSEGPPVWPDLPPEVLASNPAFFDDNPEKTKGWYASPKTEQNCRSIFLVQKRNTRVPMLETFDLPDNSTPCARRQTSTVAPQALTLLNGPLAVEAAQAFAERVRGEAGDDPARQVEQAFALALNRRPDDAESTACQRLIAEHSLAELCRVLANLNEFVYLD